MEYQPKFSAPQFFAMAPASQNRLQLACRLNDEFPLQALEDRAPAHPLPPSPIPARLIQTAEQNRFGRNHHQTLTQLRERNPELHCELWDAERRDSYMQTHWGEHPIGQLYRKAQFGAMRADLFRYCVIHDRGGFYLDINKLLIQPLRSFLKPNSEGLISFEQTWCQLPPPPAAAGRLAHPDRYVLQWCFGFRAGHPLLTLLLEAIVALAPGFDDRVFRDPGEAIRSFTGPGVFTATVRRYLEQQEDPHLVQAGIDFDGSLRYPAGRDLMYLISPHYKTAKNRAILRTENTGSGALDRSQVDRRRIAEREHARGLISQGRGEFAVAIQAYRAALEHEPGRIRSLNNLAVLEMQRGDLKAAADLLQAGLEQPQIDPDLQALLWNTHAQLLLRQHRPDEARQWCCQRAQLKPDAATWSNLSMALRDEGKLAASERSQRLALSLVQTDANERRRMLQNLAVLQLEQDPWRLEHWQSLEARLEREPLLWRHLWRGDSTDALLVWDEQGFGDAMQCLRWLPQTLERCRQLTLRLRPALLPLAQAWLQTQAVPRGSALHLEVLNEADGPAWRCSGTGPHCPLMSLPVALGLDGADTMATPNLPHAAPLPRSGRIGLVWAAGSKPEADARCRSEQRSLPPATLVRVLDELLDDQWRGGRCELVNLQQDRPVPEHPSLQQHLPAAMTTNDWLETARLVRQLDGVITVDTAMAHLCGLIGSPTTLILNQPCDWRWQQCGERSPWYPGMRLLRMRWQPISGSASPPPAVS